MEPDEPMCKRGRPREFDAEAALDAALLVFWRHGYEGTSLTDLTAAMGINRPSLYAAFGNKESLFRRAMDRYGARTAGSLQAALAEPTARGAVERLLRASADGADGCGGPAGCFLVQAAMTCGPAAEPVRAEVAARRGVAYRLLLDRFERAAAAGELPPCAPPADLAAYFATLLHGLAVQAAGGVGREALHRVIDVALRAWPAAPTGRKPAGYKRRPPS